MNKILLLKNKLHVLYKKVGIESDRTKNITNHVLLSTIYKGGAIAANFLLVPITLDYLDAESYGLWLILSSFISWFYFFDIGLGNGLRNKFAEAKALGDMSLAKGYVSSAYFTIGAVSLGLFLIFLATNFFIDWSKIFNSGARLAKDLSYLMPIVFGLFCVQLVLKLITTIYSADQNHSMDGKINFFTQILTLLVVWGLTFTNKSSLLIFGAVFSGLPVIILIGINFYGFTTIYEEFKPKFNLWKKEYLMGIFGLGFKFFIIQISGIILFSTDNFIIAQLYGPEAVVPYNIVYKYFSASNMILIIIMAPYWSSITEAYVKRDFIWLKKSMKSLIVISLCSIILLLIMVLFSAKIYKVWIGSKISIPSILSIFTAFYFATNIICNPFTALINGTGKITLQLYSLLITAIINIPLSIYLATNLELGISGVILATAICLVPYSVLSAIQSYKILNNNATGIWDK